MDESVSPKPGLGSLFGCVQAVYERLAEEFLDLLAKRVTLVDLALPAIGIISWVFDIERAITKLVIIINVRIHAEWRMIALEWVVPEEPYIEQNR